MSVPVASRESVPAHLLRPNIAEALLSFFSAVVLIGVWLGPRLGVSPLLAVALSLASFVGSFWLGNRRLRALRGWYTSQPVSLPPFVAGSTLTAKEQFLHRRSLGFAGGFFLMLFFAFSPLPVVLVLGIGPKRTPELIEAGIGVTIGMAVLAYLAYRCLKPLPALQLEGRRLSAGSRSMELGPDTECRFRGNLALGFVSPMYWRVEVSSGGRTMRLRPGSYDASPLFPSLASLSSAGNARYWLSRLC